MLARFVNGPAEFQSELSGFAVAGRWLVAIDTGSGYGACVPAVPIVVRYDRRTHRRDAHVGLGAPVDCIRAAAIGCAVSVAGRTVGWTDAGMPRAASI